MSPAEMEANPEARGAEVEMEGEVVPDFNVFAGCVNGLVKGINVSGKGVIAKNLTSLNKTDPTQDEVTCMAFDSDKEAFILTGIKDGSVKKLEVKDKAVTLAAPPPDNTTEDRALRGLFRHQGTGSLVTASQSGIVRIWKPSTQEEAEPEVGVSCDVIEHQLSSAAGSKLKKGDFEGEDGEEERLKHVALLKAGRQLTTMVQSPNQHNVFATGGKEHELHLWDLNRNEDCFQKPLFQAKNVRHDKLELRVPVWISGIAFCPENPDSRVGVVSKHGHVRQYDIRCGQRRPVIELEWADEAPTSCAALAGGHQILVGSGTGKVVAFDWRNTGKKDTGIVQKYRGCVGSVRSIRPMTSSSSHFATVGLDRFLRIYDVNAPKPAHKVYLKSKLNCVLLTKDFDGKNLEKPKETSKTVTSPENVLKKSKGKEEENLKEDEKFWTKMKIIREKPDKKKRKQTASQIVAEAKRKR